MRASICHTDSNLTQYTATILLKIGYIPIANATIICEINVIENELQSIAKLGTLPCFRSTVWSVIERNGVRALHGSRIDESYFYSRVYNAASNVGIWQTFLPQKLGFASDMEQAFDPSGTILIKALLKH